ncbi:MAG: 30S ribosomal protein S5 [Candidatus Nomurabacteria bacterium]|jgi:small subunit ribosomal protein S5|nr:30S ribosomal protein S5 [Candidatus Nomurabacteria bacterium]
MAEEVKKTTAPAEASVEQAEQKPATNGTATPKKTDTSNRQFGAANNFSSENMARDGRNNNRGRRDNRNRGDRRDNSRGNRRDNKPVEEKIFEEQTIAVDRVSRTVKGGRRLRFKALVVVGDKKTRVGVGIAKGRDVQQAVEKATGVAKKHMITIPLDKTTIPHEIETKVTGAHVLLKPAAPGTGIIAGGVVRSIIGVTGISDLLSKSLGSANKVNIAYATIEALKSLVPKSEWVGAKKKPVANKGAEKASK